MFLQSKAEGIPSQNTDFQNFMNSSLWRIGDQGTSRKIPNIKIIRNFEEFAEIFDFLQFF